VCYTFEMLALADALAVVGSRLCCPSCHASLLVARNDLTCAACGERWSRPSGGHLDLRVGAWDAATSRWQQRQDETTRYYDDLKAHHDEAALAFRSDLAPFGETLSKYGGSVVDVGGGNGIVRDLLPDPAQYVSVDPSTEWLAAGWDALADVFPCLEQPLSFVQAYAEHLPFVDGTFDAAVCMFTLNHCANPVVALRETARVVRPGGHVLLVLEDGEPFYAEILSGAASHYLIPSRAGLFAAKLMKPLRGWPTQTDHVAVVDSMLDDAAAGRLELVRRWWAGCYLALEYRRMS
jgi:ubiquinone/menaquinone biosynthesis C-methylase UbiE